MSRNSIDVSKSYCCLQIQVQSRHMSVHLDQSLDVADSQLISALINSNTKLSLRDSAPLHPHRHRHHRNRDNNKTLSSSLLTPNKNLVTEKTSRSVFLYNRCSGGYLQFYGKSINALGDQKDQFGMLSSFTLLIIIMA